MTIQLKINGLRLSDIAVDISPRTALIGPNGSGKSIILHALRCAANGKVNVLAGNTPGAMTSFSKNGTLTISAQVGESEGVEQIIDKPGQVKVPTLPGYDCVLANLQLDGSAAATRAFLAENLKLDPSVTRAIVSKRLGFDLPAGNSIIDSLAAASKKGKDASKVARAAFTKSKAAASGVAVSAAGLEVDVAGDLRTLQNKNLELLSKRRETDAKIKENAEDVRRWNAAQIAATNSRERYETEKSTVPRYDNPTEAEINEWRERLKKAEAAAIVLDKEWDERNAEFLNAKEKVEALQKLRSELSPPIETKCESCNSPLLDKRYTENDSLIGAAEDIKNATIEPAMRADYKVKNAKSYSDSIQKELDRILKTKSTELELATRRDALLYSLETAANEAAEAAAGMIQPGDVDALKAELIEIDSQLTKAGNAVSIAQQRQAAQQTAVRLKSEEIAAKVELDRCISVEETIKSVRDELLIKPAAALASEMTAIAGIMDYDRVLIDPGDDERDPEIAVVKNGEHEMPAIGGGRFVWTGQAVMPFHAISEGRRAAFLAMLAARTLERSAAPVEKRILLIEAGACDEYTIREVLRLVHGCAIGHIVAASHGNMLTVDGYTSPAYYGTGVEF